MELKQGRPQEKRIAKEERVYDLLENYILIINA